MAKIVLTPVTNGQDLSSINTNFSNIAAALNAGVFWKDNPVGTDNAIEQDTDYNGHKIYNVTDITVNGISVATQVASAEAAAVAANASAVSASASANAAAASAAGAGAILVNALNKNNNLSDVASVAISRTNLGLGSAAVQNTNVFVQVANNLSDVVASTARTNLGLTSAATTSIGTSGATIPLLSTLNTWTLAQNFSQGVAIDNTVASGQRNLSFKTSGLLRWNTNASTTAESGSNVGSDYFISRYNDAGTIIDSPVSINRATGLFTIGTALTVNGLITPSTTIGIKGTGTNDSAQAGSIGEYVTSSTGATGFTSNTGINAASIVLQPGDWDVSGSIAYAGASSAVISAAYVGVSLVSATVGTDYNNTFPASIPNGTLRISSPVVRVSISVATTVYITGLAAFTPGTCSAAGLLRARRVR